MTTPWRDLKDRIKTEHPAAVVTLDDVGIRVEWSGQFVTVYASKGGWCLDWLIGDMHQETSRHDSSSDAADRVMEILNDAWRAEQRFKSSPGGPSSPSGGNCAAVSGDYYKVSDDSDDGGDE